MKTPIILFDIMFIMGLLASCTTPGGNGGQQSVAQSDKPRITDPAISPTDLASLTSSNASFAFSLYQQLRNQAGNLIYSPHSISVALAMTTAGARGNTEQQMNRVMHFDLPKASLHPAFNALQLELASREKNKADPNQVNFRLKIVNALWGQKEYRFLADFLDFLAQNYGAGMRLLDFRSDPEICRQIINDWVAQQTEEKIKDLIPKGVITSATRLVLTNAIYFNAPWMYQFQESATRPGLFTLLDKSQVEVPMMNISQQFGSFQGDGFTAVELPYAGNQVSMFLLVPDTGKFEEFEQNLTATQWEKIRQQIQPSQVKLSMPRFTFISDYNMNETLIKLGMTDAFNPNAADFSGMDGTRSLYIQRVQHKAFIKLDEKGTEAAAATAVVVRKMSMPSQQVEIKVDRPFLFLIQDKPSGAILFVGRVLNPAQ